ncbi:MAG: hypothetical protein L6R38_005422 [Xanthoria sp. 2 TBL-2021]|nr:MAG: hypothetical protein L6R38_005422 [Xanthoria sp. 2 TBL-2021]
MHLTTLLIPLLSLLTLTLGDKQCKTGLGQKGPCSCSCPYPFTILYNGNDETNDMPYWCRGTEVGTEELNQIYGPIGYIDRSKSGEDEQKCVKSQEEMLVEREQPRVVIGRAFRV